MRDDTAERNRCWWGYHTPVVIGFEQTTRAALRLSSLILWANYLLTERWAHVAGSIHGPKEPWFLAALVALTAAVWWPRRTGASAPGSAISPSIGVWLFAAALGATVFAVLTWFPPSVWNQAPFLDDWPPRFQSTREFIARAWQGTFAGWQWNFLGGYHTSSDVTQSLGALGWLPMILLGDAVGFHALHLMLFLAIPALLWADLRLADHAGSRDDEARALMWIGAGLGAWCALNYSYFLIRSGDTNSLAGVVTTLSALLGAHAARRGHRWGPAWLVSSLVLVIWSHAGSFVYALLYLAADAALARDWRSAIRAGIAAATALIAALPMNWESWRYPELFSFNNVYYLAPTSINWGALAQKVAYNIELLWLPGRWFNDYGGMALVFLPVAVATAWAGRGRTRVYAVWWLLTVALMRLNDPHFGYAFLRPIHMLVVFAAPVLAAAVARAWSRPVAWALLATVVLYVQVWWMPVPHVRSIRDFNAELTDRVATANGALVLVEMNPHRDTNADPDGETVPSRFGTHFESMLADTTGRRLYSGQWDGWQWNPWKGEMLGGGTLMGRSVTGFSHDEFRREMDRWGVVDLFVWSDVSRDYLKGMPDMDTVWSSGDWTQFKRRNSDGREVVTSTGRGMLRDRRTTGAIVALDGVTAGTPVVVRTHFHPAWQARTSDDGGAVPVAVRDEDGQLAFAAPCTGACDVELVYPRRPWLTILAALAWISGAWFAAAIPSRP